MEIVKFWVHDLIRLLQSSRMTHPTGKSCSLPRYTFVQLRFTSWHLLLRLFYDNKDLTSQFMPSILYNLCISNIVDNSSALFTLSLSILIMNAQCGEGARDHRSHFLHLKTISFSPQKS